MVLVAHHQEFHHRLGVVEVEARCFERGSVLRFEVLKDDGTHRHPLMNLDAEPVPMDLGEWLNVVAVCLHTEEIHICW